MSYIPKYILKRMIPQDAMKAAEGGVEITLTNVISPLSVDEIPAGIDPLEYLEVKMDGEEISAEELKGLKLTFEDTTIGIDNIEDALGKTIPVGGQLKIFFPTDKISAGEEHEVEVTIKTDNPINIKVSRTVQ